MATDRELIEAKHRLFQILDSFVTAVLRRKYPPPEYRIEKHDDTEYNIFSWIVFTDDWRKIGACDLSIQGLRLNRLYIIESHGTSGSGFDSMDDISSVEDLRRAMSQRKGWAKFL